MCYRKTGNDTTLNFLLVKKIVKDFIGLTIINWSLNLLFHVIAS